MSDEMTKESTSYPDIFELAKLDTAKQFEFIESLGGDNYKSIYIVLHSYAKTVRYFKEEPKKILIAKAINKFIIAKEINLYKCFNAVDFLKKHAMDEFSIHLKYSDRLSIKTTQIPILKILIPLCILFFPLFFLFTAAGVFITVTVASEFAVLGLIGGVVLGFAAAVGLPFLIYNATIPVLQSLEIKDNPHEAVENLEDSLIPLTKPFLSFLDISKSYSSFGNFVDDLAIPFYSLRNITQGYFGLIWAILQITDKDSHPVLLNVVHSATKMFTGIGELLLSPIILLVKLPVRTLLTIGRALINDSVSKETRINNLKQTANQLNCNIYSTETTVGVRFETAKRLHKEIQHSNVLTPEIKACEKTSWKDYKCAFFTSKESGPVQEGLVKYNETVREHLYLK